MDVEPIEYVRSSTVFGGLNQRISVYQDHVVVTNPGSPVLDSVEVRYDQVSEVHLYTGVLYATLTLEMRDGYGIMVRWLPKSKATRIAALIWERVRAA
ncbi:MAG TPA: hypothetical protein VK869_12250 [Rubrobacteraceae bacterium]|nr:hypothetical protein [Rubrobacteraceae bacterium]